MPLYRIKREIFCERKNIIKNELKYLNFSSFFGNINKSKVTNADVAELADAPDSKSKWIFLIVILKSIDKYTGLGFDRI